MPSSTDRIEKKILLRAPRKRVWNAIADSSKFGSWFGVRFDAPFVAGTTLTGRIVPTTVDADVAAAQAPYEGKAFHFQIERIEPMSVFSFGWHPYAVDQSIDYSKEPTTLVVFKLEDADGGTMLTVTELGFDRIPIERRAKAFASNEEGWSIQMRLIEKYLALHPES
jgi:uncharacterized protein YndB with AHSA1/START domain